MARKDSHRWGLFCGEEAGAGAIGTDADADFAKAAGAVALVGGAGVVDVYSLIDAAALEQNADKAAAGGPRRADLGVGDVISALWAIVGHMGNFQNVIGFIKHNCGEFYQT